jgi:hypothetical protein
MISDNLLVIANWSQDAPTPNAAEFPSNAEHLMLALYSSYGRGRPLQ